MLNTLKITLMTLLLFMLSGCGGGGGLSGEAYCVGNSSHLSKYGTCIKLEKIILEPESDIYVNEERYIGFQYKEQDFVGDLDEFTYEWSFSSDDIPKEAITLTPPAGKHMGFGILQSTKSGYITVTLRVKDKDAILDTISKNIKVIERTPAILKVTTDKNYTIEPYGKVRFLFEGSRSTSSKGKYEILSKDLEFNITIVSSQHSDEIGKSKEITLDISNNSNNVAVVDSFYDAKDAIFDLKDGKYIFNIKFYDGFSTPVEKNITIDASYTSNIDIFDGNITKSIFNSNTQHLYILADNELRVYSVLKRAKLLHRYTLESSGESMSLSNNKKHLIVIDSNSKLYLFDTATITKAPKIQTVINSQLSCNNTNYTVTRIDNKTLTASDNAKAIVQGRIHDNNFTTVDYSENWLLSLDIQNGFVTCLTDKYLIDKQKALVTASNNRYYIPDINISANYSYLTELQLNSNSSTITKETIYKTKLDLDSFLRCLSFGIGYGVMVNNLYYSYNGCVWDLNSRDKNGYIHYQDIDSTLLHTIVSIYPDTQEVLYSTYVTLSLDNFKDIVNRRFINEFSTKTWQTTSEYIVNKYIEDNVAYEHRVIYACYNINKKKVAVSTIDDLPNKYLISIEK